MKIATVLVTGAAGFLGTRVVEHLLARGMAVRAHLGPLGAAAPAFPVSVRTATADIADGEALAELAHGIDAIVHLAGPPAVADSFRAPEEFFRAHVMGTASMVRLWEHGNVARFVYVSSAEIYGRPALSPAVEWLVPAPRSPYGAAKAAAELVVAASSRSSSRDAVLLRPFSVYGPGMRRQSMLGEILRQLPGGRIRLRDLRPVRDHVYVDDVAAAVAAALAVPACPDVRCFNVGSGHGISVRALAAMAAEVAGRSVTIENLEAADRPAAADLFELVADVGAARRDLGWQPATDLRAGLARTLGWFSSTVAA